MMMAVSRASGLTDRTRWRTPEGVERRREVEHRLVTGGALVDVAFGELNGRQDLRGFETTRVIELRDVTLESIDLTRGSLPAFRLFGCRLRDCVLTPPIWTRSACGPRM